MAQPNKSNKVIAIIRKFMVRGMALGSSSGREKSEIRKRFSLRFFGRQFHFALWRASHDRRQRVEIINKLSTKRCKSSLYQTSQTTESSEAETYVELTKLTLSIDVERARIFSVFFHDDFSICSFTSAAKPYTFLSLYPSSPINKFFICFFQSQIEFFMLQVMRCRLIFLRMFLSNC